ncbi:hypothetical protein [Nocardia sp. NPDC050175]|uniref:hypothetical protein n=1 Tax=Nocardia sp. NPDC050175 TaxID=3364317 RepID=UPI0037A2444B
MTRQLFGNDVTQISRSREFAECENVLAAEQHRLKWNVAKRLRDNGFVQFGYRTDDN